MDSAHGSSNQEPTPQGVTTQTHQVRVAEVPASEAFTWHTRPGAMLRLTPAALASVVAEPEPGLAVGTRARLRVGPGPGIGWVAEHTERWSDPDTGRYGFVDEQLRGPFRRWQHRHLISEADPSGAVIRDEVSWALPRLAGPGRGITAHQVERMLQYRARQVVADLTWQQQHPGPRLSIAVTGAGGLVGRQLVAFLSSQGHRVRALRRGSDWDPDQDWVARGVLDEVDVVVHLAGEPIGRRFTAAHKERILTSRTRSTALLARTLADLSADGRERSLVCASAMGWYGADTGDVVLDEDRPSGHDFLAEVCRAWEQAAEPARAAGLRTVHVRTGIVQSATGGQLALQLPLFRAGVGGPLGSGRQWMSWIALDDLVGLYALAVVDPSLSGPVNAAAPEPVRADEYAAVLAKVLSRPHALRVPPLGPRLLLGREGAEQLALADNRLSSARAESWGHRFRFPDLDAALRHELCVV